MSGPYGRRPPYRRRDRDNLGFACTLLLGVLGAIIGFAVYFSIPAHSSDCWHPIDICAELRAGTPVVLIEKQLIDNGFRGSVAAEFTVNALRTECPDQIANVMGQIA